MNYVVKVKDHIKSKIPTVVHIDGTSRAHSVLKKTMRFFIIC